jgi:hypothetical protein
MISLVYITCRGPWPFTSEKMRGLGQYDTLSDSLRAQTFTDFELVVVDFWNTIPRPELNWLGDRVKFVRPRETPWDTLWAKNISVARNAGLKEARGETVLGLDDCISFGPRFLRLVADHVSRGEYLAPTLMQETGNAENPWTRLHQWPDAAGGLLAYPRQLALDLGGHEERFTGCHSLEDWEFCQRMVRNGMRLVHDDSEHIDLYKHGFKNPTQFRCAWEVYGLVRGQQLANRKWTRAQYDHFADPVCGFLHDGHCAVKTSGQGCSCKPRPTAAALDIMLRYETEGTNA